MNVSKMLLICVSGTAMVAVVTGGVLWYLNRQSPVVIPAGPVRNQPPPVLHLEPVAAESLMFHWDSLAVRVVTDCGVYSDRLGVDLQRSGQVSGKTRQAIREEVMSFFVGTSPPSSDVSLRVDQWMEAYGEAHSLPIIAVVALQNLQAPLPVLFGDRKPYDDLVGTTVVQKEVGFIDSSRPDTVHIMVSCDRARYQARAANNTHLFSAAYYDPDSKEIGLFFDLDRFRRYNSELEADSVEADRIVSAFAGYAVGRFNDYSSHELVHVYQDQAKDPAYAVTFVREGESLVQGFARRRAGLRYQLLYGDFLSQDRDSRDPDHLAWRVQVAAQAGNVPITPLELELIDELRAARMAGKLQPLDRLLRLDRASFYSGSAAEVRLRYLQAWVAYKVALNNKALQEGFQSAARSASTGARFPVDSLRQLQAAIDAFLTNPIELQVPFDSIWSDAERIYQIDRTFAGFFYAWAHVAAPDRYLPLVYLGDAMYRARYFEAADRYYRAAARKEPRARLPLIRLGDVALKGGDTAVASSYYRRALDGTPVDGADSASVDFLRALMPAHVRRALDLSK